MDHLIEVFFGLNVHAFKDVYTTLDGVLEGAKEYPNLLHLVSFVSQYGYFIGAGALRFGDSISINFSKDQFPLLMIVEGDDPNIDHAVIYNKGRLIDLSGKTLNDYKDKIIAIYPIIKIGV